MKSKTNLVKDAARILSKNKFRIKDVHGNPGGLIDLQKDKRSVLIVGDLHGSVENLKAVVEHEDNKENLKKGKSVLVLVGDAFHNDQTGQMKEMESSAYVLEEIIRLINIYRDNLIFIRGNHDTFDENLVKSGIRQGLEFKNYLLKTKKSLYVKAVEQMLKCLPYCIVGDNYVITHAGPVRNGASRREIINIADNPDYARQLMWNRLNEFRGTPNMKEYSEYDIQKMLIKLNMPEDSYFIVGHNPLWNTGNHSGIWSHVMGIRNHYIIYSNIGTPSPYLKINKGKLEEKYGSEITKEVMYV